MKQHHLGVLAVALLMSSSPGWAQRVETTSLAELAPAGAHSWRIDWTRDAPIPRDRKTRIVALDAQRVLFLHERQLAIYDVKSKRWSTKHRFPEACKDQRVVGQQLVRPMKSKVLQVWSLSRNNQVLSLGGVRAWAHHGARVVVATEKALSAYDLGRRPRRLFTRPARVKLPPTMNVKGLSQRQMRKLEKAMTDEVGISELYAGPNYVTGYFGERVRDTAFMRCTWKGRGGLLLVPRPSWRGQLKSAPRVRVLPEQIVLYTYASSEAPCYAAWWTKKRRWAFQRKIEALEGWHSRETKDPFGEAAWAAGQPLLPFWDFDSKTSTSPGKLLDLRSGKLVTLTTTQTLSQVVLADGTVVWGERARYGAPPRLYRMGLDLKKQLLLALPEKGGVTISDEFVTAGKAVYFTGYGGDHNRLFRLNPGSGKVSCLLKLPNEKARGRFLSIAGVTSGTVVVVDADRNKTYAVIGVAR